MSLTDSRSILENWGEGGGGEGGRVQIWLDTDLIVEIKCSYWHLWKTFCKFDRLQCVCRCEVQYTMALNMYICEIFWYIFKLVHLQMLISWSCHTVVANEHTISSYVYRFLYTATSNHLYSKKWWYMTLILDFNTLGNIQYNQCFQNSRTWKTRWVCKQKNVDFFWQVYYCYYIIST